MFKCCQVTPMMSSPYFSLMFMWPSSNTTWPSLATWPVGTSRKDASNRSRGPKATRNSSRRPLRRSAGDIIGFFGGWENPKVKLGNFFFAPLLIEHDLPTNTRHILSFWNENIRLLWLWRLLSWCLSITWHSHLLMHNTLIYDISHLPPVDLKKKA